MNVLELKDVSKSFGGLQAVDGLSLGLSAGKITALIGPNGAGKTTLFNLISGFLRVDEGAIYFKDKDITGLAPWHIATMGLGRVFQDVRLFGHLTVLQNVMAAFKGQVGESISAAIFRRARIAKQEKDLAE